MSDQVREQRAALLFSGRPTLNRAACIAEWRGWDYIFRVENDLADGAELFKGGAYVILRIVPELPELPWNDLEQQAALLAGVPDTFDHEPRWLRRDAAISAWTSPFASWNRTRRRS